VKPTKTLGPEYLPAASLDMGSKKVALAFNLVGIGALFLFGWLLFQLADSLRPGILAPSSFILLGGPELLALIAGILGVVLLHELIHGLFFFVYTGERFQLGIRPFYAFAASPTWYIPRGQFSVIGLAPFLLITLLGFLLLLAVPLSTAAVILVSMVINAAGSAGDIIVVGWLFAGPARRLIQDRGDDISIYETVNKQLSDMSRLWLDLITSYGADDAAARWLFRDIIDHYEADGRYYHNLEHVRSVLDTIAQLETTAVDYRAIQLAAWFHDLVYLPDSPENEAQSAEFAYQSLLKLGISESTARRVKDLILMTTDHKPPDDDIDAQILIDADLAPLAISNKQFREHALALRQESAQVPEDEFNASRKAFLTQIFDRDQIYKTELLHDSLAERARENIKQSLASLP
jgi:predicted metal-dependent HD superfamily phosphohydrolase